MLKTTSRGLSTNISAADENDILVDQTKVIIRGACWIRYFAVTHSEGEKNPTNMVITSITLLDMPSLGGTANSQNADCTSSCEKDSLTEMSFFAAKTYCKQKTGQLPCDWLSRIRYWTIYAVAKLHQRQVSDDGIARGHIWNTPLRCTSSTWELEYFWEKCKQKPANAATRARLDLPSRRK